MNAAVVEFRARVRIEAICTVPTVLITTVTAISFVSVFGTWGFLWPLLAMAVLSHLLGALVRAAQPPVLIATAAPLAIVYVLLGWLRFDETLRFGLPLSETWTLLWRDLRSAWNLVGDVVTPVSFDSGFGTTAVVVIGLVAVVTDAFATRYGGRVEVFIPSAATVFIVAAVGTGRDRILIPTVWITTALFSAALIRRTRAHVRRASSTRARRTGSSQWTTSLRATIGALAFVGIVGAAAAVIAPLLPGSTDEAWLTQRLEGQSRQLQPLVDVRRQLAETTPALLFTVRSDTAAYWRLTALPDFDGSTWTVSDRLLNSAAGDLDQPIGASDPGVVPVPNLQRFTLESLAGSLVPVAATPTQLRSSTQSLFFEPETGSLLVGSGGIRPRDSYDIQSTMLTPRPERLLMATSDAPPDDDNLDLPDSAVMRQLREAATSIVSTTLSPYQQALALQDYFRSEFTYSLDVPPIAGTDATLEFLERRTGYCEHFASTFAIFARALGLPARVAIGFTPGDRAELDSGATLFSVSTTHAHAWPEVWFDGIGWVLFEPTPGRGAPNATYTNVAEEQAEEVAPATTVAPTTTTTSPPPTATPDSTAEPEGAESPIDSQSESDRNNWPLALLIAVVALFAGWILLLPRAVRSLIARRSEPPILRLWRQAIALYELERGALPRSLSPHELAHRATSRLYDDDPFIFELAETASQLLFDEPADGSAPSNPTADAQQTLQRGRSYIRERRQRLSPTLRLRLHVDPWAIWKFEGGPSKR